MNAGGEAYLQRLYVRVYAVWACTASLRAECMQEMSLEELAGDDISARQLARIIKGESSPSYNTAKRLLDKLGLKGVQRSDFIVADDIYLHKLWDEYSEYSDDGDYIRAEKIYYEMKRKLDTSIEINRIVVDFMRIELNLGENRIGYAEALEKYEKLLPFNLENVGKYKYLTTIEEIIINHCIYCIDMLKLQDRMPFMEAELDKYSLDELSKRRYTSVYEGIAVRYANYAGNIGEYVKSNEVAEAAVKVIHPGWTLEDIGAYIENNETDNKNMTLFKYWDRNYAAKELLSYSMDEFVDLDNGVCDFTSDSFTDFLNILMALPGEVDYSVDDDRSEAMQACMIYTFQSLQESKIMFGDDYVIKGYPTDDGREQHSLELIDAYSVMSGSKHKEGAWEFLKFCLQSDVEGGYFTVNKSKLQAMIDEELAHAGEETERQFYTSVGVFDYHYATQEEVEEVMRLINNASIRRDFDDEVIDIIIEETEGYFAGIKPVEEVVRIIQDRVQIYLDEQN